MLLEGILHGRGSVTDLALIEALSETMALTSICGLGQAAPNPILSVIKYFKEDITRYITRWAALWGWSAETVPPASALRSFGIRVGGDELPGLDIIDVGCTYLHAS